MKPPLLSLLLTTTLCVSTAYGANSDWEDGPPNQQKYVNNKKPKVQQTKKAIDAKLWKTNWDQGQELVTKGQFLEAVKALEAAVNCVLGSEAGNTRLHETLQVLRPLYLRLGMMDHRRALIEEMQRTNTPLYLILEAERIGTVQENVVLIDHMIAASKYKGAEELCELVLTKDFDELSFDAKAKLIDRLTRIWYHEKKFEKAETYLRNHLKEYATKKNGKWGKDERTYIAYLSADLALIFMATEKFPEAEELWSSSIEILSEMYPPSYPKIIIDTSDLALLHTKMGKLGEAVKEYEVSYTAALEQPLISNPSRKTIATNYAKALRDAGDTGRAKRIEKTEHIEVEKQNKGLFSRFQ